MVLLYNSNIFYKNKNRRSKRVKINYFFHIYKVYFITYNYLLFYFFNRRVDFIYPITYFEFI